MHHTSLIRPRALALSLTTFAAVAAAPSVATAATLCVGDTACVAAGGMAKASIQVALTAAGTTPEADTVRIGPGTFMGNLEYSAASPVTIVGAGRDQTFLRQSVIGRPNYLRALKLESPVGTANIVSDLSVELSGAGARGLELSNGATARRIDVIGAPQHAFGLIGTGSTSTAEDVAIELKGDGNTGAFLGSDHSLLQRATISAETGVYTSGGLSSSSVTALRGLRITPGRTGIDVAGGVTNAESVVVDVRGVPDARGLWVESQQGYAKRRLVGRHLTVVGSPGFGEARGLLVESADAQKFAQFELSESLVVGFSTAVELKSSSGGWATGILRNSYHGAFVHNNKPNGQGGLSDIAPIQLYGDVGFNDPAHGDFSLRASSPMVDAGSTDPFFDLDSPFDVTGASRVVDGNGDGTARRDVGAFERPAAPVEGKTTDLLTSTGDGPAPTTTEESTPVTPPTATPAPEPKSPADAVAPQLSKLRVTTSAHGKRTKRTARFTVDEASTVTITLARKSGRRWVPAKGTLTIGSKGGPTNLAVPTKLGGKTLKPGTYRLTALARDAAGNAGVAQGVTFRLNP